MKQTMTSNHSFVKRILFGCLIFFSFFSSTVHAADVSLVSKKVSGTTATITVKFENHSIIKDANIYLVFGNSEEVLGFSTKGTPRSDGTYTESIANLKIGRTYTIHAQFLKNGVALSDGMGTGGLGTVTATTSDPTPLPPTKPELPVEFVKSSTTTSTNTITVTVKNKSTSTFIITVTAKQVPSGTAVDPRKTTLAPNATGTLSFTGLATKATYDLTMTGVATGSSTSYQSVSYKGLKTTDAPQGPLTVILTPNTATGTSITATVANTQSSTAYALTLLIEGAGKTETKTATLDAGSGKQTSVVFDGLTKDTNYAVTVTGTPTPTTGEAFGPKKYTVNSSGTVVTGTGDDTGGTATPTPAPKKGTCEDDIDNDGDGTADWDGGKDASGATIPADPGCLNKDSKEVKDSVAKGSLVPCTNDCDFSSVFELINKLIDFLITDLLLPVAVLMFVYAGYKYITAEGNPGKRADVKKMVGHLILGMLIILLAWVIVKTLLGVIGYTNELYFFE